MAVHVTSNMHHIIGTVSSKAENVVNNPRSLSGSSNIAPFAFLLWERETIETATEVILLSTCHQCSAPLYMYHLSTFEYQRLLWVSA